MSKRYRIFAAAMAAVMALTGCSSSVGAKETLLKVNNTEIKTGSYNFLLRFYQAQSYSYYEYMYPMFGMEVPDVIWGNAVQDKEADTESGAGKPVSAPGETETESAAELSIETEKAKTEADTLKNDVAEDIVKMVAAKDHLEELGLSLDKHQVAIEEAANSFINSNDSKILNENRITKENVVEMLELMTAKELAEHELSETAEVEVTDEESQMSKFTYAVFSASTFEPQETESEEEETESVTENESVNEESLLSEEFETEELTEAQTQEQENIDYSQVAYDSAVRALEAIKQIDMTNDSEILGILHGEKDSIYLSSDAYLTNSDENDTSLPDEVVNAAKGLEEGKFAETVVEASDGNYYLIRLDAKNDAESTASKKEELEQEKRDAYAEETINKWAMEADVTVNTKAINKIDVSDSVIYKEKAEDNEDEHTVDVGAEETSESVESDMSESVTESAPETTGTESVTE